MPCLVEADLATSLRGLLETGLMTMTILITTVMQIYAIPLQSLLSHTTAFNRIMLNLVQTSLLHRHQMAMAKVLRPPTIKVREVILRTITQIPLEELLQPPRSYQASSPSCWKQMPT